MDGVGTGAPQDLDDAVDVEVGLGRPAGAERVGLVGDPHVEGVAIGLRVDGGGQDAELPAGPRRAPQSRPGSR